MELWTQWLNVIHSLLIFLSSEVGLGTGLGIVVLTLLLRTVIFTNLVADCVSRVYSAKENAATATRTRTLETGIWRGTAYLR